MKAPSIPPRFPKIESPFKRHENKDGEYVVYNEWNLPEQWLKNETIAVEKLDGTNCAVYIEGGRVQDAFTRMGDRSMNFVHPYPTKGNHAFIVSAVRNGIQRGFFDELAEGYHFGEVVGPKIGGNPHELDKRYFVPFEWARDNLRYKSWGDYPQNFDDLSLWFEADLFSLFKCKMHNVSIADATVNNGTYCEGIMFTDESTPHAWRWDNELATFKETPKSGQFAKLRRDMFEWYEGSRH